MSKNLILFTVGSFEFRLQHLLIIGILSLAFSMSMLIRSQGIPYGFELNEFDPFFNYRATEFIVSNGISEYFDWHDDRSWYPFGRNVSETSQVMLHVTTALLYQIFGGTSDLYDFSIMFPVVIGSLSTIVLFALVRVFAGTTAGLLASMFFAVSLPIVLRGTTGWFKSEPLGIFFALVGLYLFFSAIKYNKGKISFAKIISGALFTAFALSAWGGTQFYLVPLGLFFLALPFLRSDHKFIVWAVPLFSVALILFTLAFERPAYSFVVGYGGVILILPTIFMIICCLIKKLSSPEKQLRNYLVFIGSLVISGGTLIFSNILSYMTGVLQYSPLPAFRYLNAVNPFLLAEDALTDSVSEHVTTSLETSFHFLSIFIIFAGIGIWLIFNNVHTNQDKKKFIRNDMLVFVLLISLFGVYTSSAFIRLEIFASFAVVILSAIGISILIKSIFKNMEKTSTKNLPRSILKISSFSVIIFLLTVPLVFPLDPDGGATGGLNWVDYPKYPATILNGGTNYGVSHSDWPHALQWIKTNTDQDSVFFSWWDYGYWITTVGDRISLADNATLIDHQIEKIGYVFFKNENDAWSQLTKPHSAELVCDNNDRCAIGMPTNLSEVEILETGFDADYVLIFIAAYKASTANQQPYYILEGGGDESKIAWFAKIAGFEESKFLQSDNHTPNNDFWNNTMLGKLIPFSTAGFVEPATERVYPNYQPGLVPVYSPDIKYQGNSDGPFKLVYASPSIDRMDKGPVTIVLIYEINKNYVKLN